MWLVGFEIAEKRRGAPPYLRRVMENVAVVTALGFEPALKALALITVELVTRNSRVNANEVSVGVVPFRV